MPYPTSDLSQENVLRDVHDQTTQTLRVSATALVPPGLEVEISAADGDNIAISDGTDTLAVNADGSLNVNILNPLQIEVSAADGDNVAIKPDGSQSYQYNEVTSVGSSTLTTVLTYIAISNKLLNLVKVSGTNIAEYRVLINGSVVCKERTYFGNSLNLEIPMLYTKIAIGDTLEIKVIHFRSSLGDFNSTIFLENQ